MKNNEAVPQNFSVPSATNTTCERARELSRQVGVRVFWRPDGAVNWMLPDYDLAQVLEG